MNLQTIENIKAYLVGSGAAKLRIIHCRTLKSIGFAALITVLILSFASTTGAQRRRPLSPEFSDAPSIAFRPKTVVSGDRIYLKNILDASSDPKLADKIGNLFVGYSPRPGREKKLTGSWIVSKLRNKKLLPRSAELSIPKYIRVSRAYQQLNIDNVKRIFIEYITSRIGHTDFDVRQFKVRGVDKYPTGRMTLNVRHPIPKKLSGRVSLRIAAAIGGKEKGRLTATGWIDRFESVVCAGRYLQRNTVLTEADLKMKRMNISKAPANLVLRLKDAVGKRLKQTIKPEMAMRHNMLAVPPLIRKGDRVKLVAQRGALRIVTMGIAKNSAALGDQIRIENISSKKTVVGRVKNHSTVHVMF